MLVLEAAVVLETVALVLLAEEVPVLLADFAVLLSPVEVELESAAPVILEVSGNFPPADVNKVFRRAFAGLSALDIGLCGRLPLGLLVSKCSR